MQWTYDITTSIGQVRLLIGDTDVAAMLLADEEIEFLLSTRGGVVPSAILGCETLATKFAREADKAVGPLRISASQKAIAYQVRADALRAQLGVEAAPVFGGQTQSAKQTELENTDATQPFFRRDMMDQGYPPAIIPSDSQLDPSRELP